MLRGELNIWKNKDLDQLQEAVIDVVENVGMRVENTSILEILFEKGAVVDKRNKTVKFPIGMIEDIISYFKDNKSDKEIRPDNFKLIIEGGGAPSILQYGKKERRKPTRKDFIDVIKLGDGLEKVKMISHPLTYSRADPKIGLIETAALLLQYTEKPVHVEVTDSKSVKYLVKMAEIFERKPSKFMTADNAITSPLICGEGTGKTLLEMAKYGIPALTVGTMPVSGLNSPVTLAGTVIIASAEILGGLIINKAINEIKIGKSKEIDVYAVLISGSFDMSTMKPVWASPEADLQDIGACQLLKSRFGIPVRIFPRYVDAKVPGVQAVFERMLKQLTCELVGGMSDLWDRGLGIGSLDGGAIFSPIQAILDIEFGKAIWRFLQGIKVNKETMALDVIKEVGIGRDYLTHEHTLRNFRQEFWFPELLDRTVQEKEEKILEKAYDKYKSILRAYKPPIINRDKQIELKKILNCAKKELLSI